MSNLLDQLAGGWSLVAAKFEFENGSVADMYGPDPSGSIVFTADKRITALLTSSSRPAMTDDISLATLFRTMMAYTGRFKLHGNELVTSVEAAWVSEWVGSQQTRFVSLDGDVLHIRTAKQTHALHPGEMLTGLLTWRKDIAF